MKIINESHGEGQETRKYAITGDTRNLDKLEVMLRFFEILGNIGHSTDLHVMWDGDGSAHIDVVRIEKNDKKVKLEKLDDMEERLSEYMNEDHNIPDGIGFD